MLESRASQHKEIILLCEQLVSLGIGFSELVAFHTAVIKRSDSANIPMESVAYRVMEEIENYDRMMGLQNEISKLLIQKYTIEQFCTERKRAITSLINLQSFDVTDEEILGVYRFLNSARLENPRTIADTALGSSLLKSDDWNLTNNG